MPALAQRTIGKTAIKKPPRKTERLHTINIFDVILDYFHIYRIKSFAPLLNIVRNVVVLTNFVDKA